MDTEDEKKTCYTCGGSGTETYTEQEQDPGMSLALGTAMGMGYFPSYRTVTRTRSCTWCHGTGKR